MWRDVGSQPTELLGSSSLLGIVFKLGFFLNQVLGGGGEVEEGVDFL